MLYLTSSQWFPIMGSVGLCMEPDFASAVYFDGTDLQKVEPVLAVPTRLLQKHGYSVLSKEVKHAELEQYIQKARLSQ